MTREYLEMKRFLVFCVAMLPAMFLSGCNSDTSVGLVKETVALLERATARVGDIKGRVEDAIKKAKADNKKIDLSEAMAATKELKEVATKAQNLKREIDRERLTITDDERKANVESQKEQLSAAFAALLKQRNELNAQLEIAERMDKRNQRDVNDLRAKIRDAESPFEAIARSFEGPGQ
jgi:hypothetical protein